MLLSAALTVPLPRFVESPGSALDLGACVTIGAADTEPVSGDLMLTTATVKRATVADLVRALLDGETEVVPAVDVVPEGVVDQEFFERQREVFASSADLAAGLGLEAAGYPSALAGEGAEIVEVLDGSPADGRLLPGDVVVAVDGEPVQTSAALVDAVVGRVSTAQQEALRLTVRRDAEELDVSVTPQPLGGETPQIGIRTSTVDPRVELPVDVEVLGGSIGGPSAGLMIALAVFDTADPVDLAAGRAIAGTGVIGPTGAVGEIGAVDKKVVTAARAGATVFLTPADQEEAARAAVPDGADLEVLGITDLDEAIEALGRADQTADPATATADNVHEACDPPE